MRTSTIAVPVSSEAVSELHALVIEPDSVRAISSILLFLHGKGEAGSSLGSLPLVCVHQTPPFQALLGHLPETLVVAPQSPPIPTIDDWNWSEYVKALAEFLTDRYAKQRVVATGFSRGDSGSFNWCRPTRTWCKRGLSLTRHQHGTKQRRTPSCRVLPQGSRDGFDTVFFATGATPGKLSALCSLTVSLIRTATPPNCRTPK